MRAPRTSALHLALYALPAIGSAMSMSHSRREPRGMDPVAVEAIATCVVHRADVPATNGAFLCEEGANVHYVCRDCGKDIGSTKALCCGTTGCTSRRS